MIAGRRYWVLIWYGFLLIGVAGAVASVYWARRNQARNLDEILRALATILLSVPAFATTVDAETEARVPALTAFHEVIYPRLGLEEGVLVVLYAAGLVALILRYRSVLLDSDILLWAVGALLFVMSVLVDGFVKDSTAFEDIPKAAGICTWLCYYWRLLMARLDAAASSDA